MLKFVNPVRCSGLRSFLETVVSDMGRRVYCPEPGPPILQNM